MSVDDWSRNNVLHLIEKQKELEDCVENFETAIRNPSDAQIHIIQAVDTILRILEIQTQTKEKQCQKSS